MSKSTTQIAVQEQPQPKPDGRSIARVVAHRYNMEPRAFVEALRSTWPTDVQSKISDHQIAAFLVVCDQYRLNPLTKEIYAFPSKGGAIVPMLGIDGWISIANAHPQFDGQEWKDIVDEKGNLVAVECTIWRKDRSRPTTVREYVSECVRPTEPWKAKARMMRHRSFMQSARYAFGFTGLAIEGDVIDGEVLEIVPQAGDVVGQVVPSAREMALQAEDEAIAASAERAKEARAAKEQDQQAPGGSEVADPADDSPSGDDAAEPGAAASEEVQDEAETGAGEDDRWRIVDEIVAELKSKTTVMDFNSAHSRRKNDIAMLTDEMQAEIGKEVVSILAKLKGAK